MDLLALAQYPSDWPDLEYLVIPAYLGDQDFPGRNAPNDGYQYGSIAVSYMKPISRGNISIQSPNMADAPLINPAWLTSEADQQQAVAAFKRTRQIFKSKPLVDNVNIGAEFYPGADIETDEQILDEVKKSFNTVFHATSTCKMGSSDDDMAVVDAHARVYGLQNRTFIQCFPTMTDELV